MRSIIIIATLTFTMSMGEKAQKVFQEIFNSSNKTLYDAREDVEIRKIALFKVDALTYINTQILAEINDSTKKLNEEQNAKKITRRDR